MSTDSKHYVRAAQLADVQAAGNLVIHIEGHAIALFTQSDKIY